MKFFKWVFTKITQNPILFLIVVIGFLLRIIGTNPGYYMHGYEVIYGDSVSMILNKTIALSYNNLAYPPLVFWIMTLAFLLIFIPLAWAGYILGHFSQFWELLSNGIVGNLDFWGQVDKIFIKEILGTRYWQNAMYWGRYITAIFSTGSIVLIYMVVKEYFNSKTAALLAAFMLAVNYKLVINSHMGFFDIYNVFFILLVLLFVGRLLKEPSRSSYVFAGITVALSFLVKYQPSAFIAFGITHLIVCVSNSRGSWLFFVKNLFNKNVILSAVVLVFILVVAHINYLVRLDEVLSYSPWVWYANEFHKYQLYLFPFSYVYHTGLGQILTVMSVAGIVLGLIVGKYRKQTLILISPILLSFYLFSYFSTGGYYTYNLLIPISLMLIFAALFFANIQEWLVNNFKVNFSSPIVISISALILAFIFKDHIYNSILSTYILSKPSYRITAEQWLNKNLKGPAIFATYTSNPRTERDDIKIIDLPKLTEVFGYQEFLEEKYNYVLIDFYKFQQIFYWWMLSPPRSPTQFWEKPDDLLAQNYFSLATRELLWSHTIAEFLPRWQASGYNYAVAEIETTLDLESSVMLEKFDFETEDGWSPLSFLERDKNQLFWSEEGRAVKGSIAVKKSKELSDKKIKILTLPGSIRWESPAIQAKSGFGYKVTAWIKNAEHTEREYRNGFIRLDFYKENNKPHATSRPIISFVSSRPYGENIWHKVEVQGIAPEDANFIKVGFQVDNPTETIFLDDLEIYESSGLVQEAKKQRFIIPVEDFFPPSDSTFL